MYHKKDKNLKPNPLLSQKRDIGKPPEEEMLKFGFWNRFLQGKCFNNDDSLILKITVWIPEVRSDKKKRKKQQQQQQQQQ